MYWGYIGIMDKKMEATTLLIAKSTPRTNRRTLSVVAIRWTPHPVIVTIRDNRGYIRVLLYSYYTTITGWGVLLTHRHRAWGSNKSTNNNRNSNNSNDSNSNRNSNYNWGHSKLEGPEVMEQTQLAPVQSLDPTPQTANIPSI